MVSIKTYALLGERCSGTNYLAELLQLNFGLEVTSKYGHKHFFGHQNYTNSDETLFVALIRDPIEWLGSFHDNPFHLAEHLRTGWMPFLQDEFWSYHDPYDTHIEIEEDHNMYNHQRYQNIFECRSVKCQFMLYDMPTLVKNYIIIIYEDLLENFQLTLDIIAKKFNFQRSNQYLNTSNYKDSKTLKYVQKTYHDKIPPDILIYIKNNLDLELEERIKALSMGNNSYINWLT
jgi:hypothetical protein